MTANADWPGDDRWGDLEALDDPAWRVRHRAVRRLARLLRREPGARGTLRERLAGMAGRGPRFLGAVYYLNFLAPSPDGPLLPEAVSPTAAPVPAYRRAAWWDEDPAVREQNLRHLTEAELRRDRPLLEEMLTLQDGWPVRDCLKRIRRFVCHAFGLPQGPFFRRTDFQSVLLEKDGLKIRPTRDRPGHDDVKALCLAALGPSAVSPLRPLGRTGLMVSPLGLSGRYRPPWRVFAEAINAGVNLFFWEPGYSTQTRFWRELPTSRRASLIVAAGSFAAEPRAVRRDAEEALRQLRVDRLGVFLLFWVRSERRLSEEAYQECDALRRRGLVETVGISTHQRGLAAQAIADGWVVVMVRHNLIHRTAEREVFPLAETHRAGVLTFSALCYGRVIREADGVMVSAADAYRYSLSQPGVSACWSAPRDLEQLRENLAVLESPTLPPEHLAELSARGERMYPSHRAFLDGIRSL